jgi:hypothetical protein
MEKIIVSVIGLSVAIALLLSLGSLVVLFYTAGSVALALATGLVTIASLLVVALVIRAILY